MTDDSRRAALARGVAELEAREGQPSALSGPLAEALRGAVFPLTVAQLVRVARENEAPGLLLSLLGSLPERPFPSLEAVVRTLEEGEPPDTLRHETRTPSLS